MELSEYQQMKAEGRVPTKGRPIVYQDRELMRVRRKEQQRRAGIVRHRALVVLQARHSDEFMEILGKEQAAYDIECGPLPGDEGSH